MTDELQVFRGKNYEINDRISIRQPTLDEICEYGEQKYFGMVRTLCATPADKKVEIWDTLHVYWDTIDEYDLFISLFEALQKEDLSILFGNLDYQSFHLTLHPKINSVILRNREGAVIDRAIYTLMTDYIRKVHRFKKNVDVGYDDYTKDAMIEDDKDEREWLSRKPFSSFLQPAISALTNCGDFKYRFDDVWTLPIGVFMDASERIQKLKGYEHMMHGIYSGNVDIKKINKRELDWMGVLS